MNKKILLAIGIVAVILVAIFFIRSTPQETLSDTDNAPEVSDLPVNDEPQSQGMPANGGSGEETEVIEEPQTESEEDMQGISLAELAQHNTETDCWVVFDGKVYDVTDYLPRHPGGKDKIASRCGSETEFEKAFLNKHGKSKVDLLMDVGVFIGDFDVMGDLDESQ